VSSHALLDYSEFEILFGVSDADDPAIGEIERLRAEFPAVAIRLIGCDPAAPNRKAGVLAELAAAARYPILVVNDSDIRVEPDYLERVLAPLEDPNVGMVTCLYRARARRLPGRFEAVGIATDFAPSVLVAPLVGVSGFALGSTMAFRADDLARIGGFASIGDFIADDYELGRRIGETGPPGGDFDLRGGDQRAGHALGRDVASPGALGADHSPFAGRRLPGLAGSRTRRSGLRCWPPADCGRRLWRCSYCVWRRASRPRWVCCATGNRWPART